MRHALFRLIPNRAILINFTILCWKWISTMPWFREISQYIFRYFFSHAIVKFRYANSVMLLQLCHMGVIVSQINYWQFSWLFNKCSWLQQYNHQSSELLVLDEGMVIGFPSQRTSKCGKCFQVTPSSWKNLKLDVVVINTQSALHYGA